MSLIITKAGLNACEQAEITGVKIQGTHMAVGDGGGETPSHTSNSPSLVNETWRGELQEIRKAESGEVEFIAHVPFTVGGWHIREVAIYADETLLAISTHPDMWKPDPESPDKLELVITAPVLFSNTDNITLTIDTTKVLASQEHVAARIAEHDENPEAHGGAFSVLASHIQDKNNPHATTAAQVGAAKEDHTHSLDAVVGTAPELLHGVVEPYLAITDAENPTIDLSARNRFVWVLEEDRVFPLLTPSKQGEWHINIYPNGNTLTFDAAYDGIIVGEPDPSAIMHRVAIMYDGISTTAYIDNKGV